jgi:glycosyltransferase involved in cell wall biosynthesis
MATTVTFITSDLTIGGAERQWTALLPGLRDLGYAVRALTLRGEGPFFHELRSQGIEMSCAGLSRRTDLAGLVRAFRFVANRTDLLVSQNINAQFVGSMIARLTRTPHVTIDHTPPGIRFRRYQDVLVRAGVQNARAVIAVSSAQIPQLESFGVPRDRIVVIPNGVDEPVPGRSRSEVRAELGFGEDDFIALLVADLRPQKEAQVFIQGVVHAHGLVHRVKGAVAGGGPELERVRAAAAAAPGAVSVLGPRLDVPDLMLASDCVCLTSATEGLPMVLLEAMSLRRAVVASDVPGITDAVVADETAILFPRGQPAPFAEALIALAADPARCVALGNSGYARYRARFTSTRMAQGYADVFDRVLAAATTGAG